MKVDEDGYGYSSYGSDEEGPEPNEFGSEHEVVSFGTEPNCCCY